MAGNGTTIRNEQLRGPLSADSSVFFGACLYVSSVDAGIMSIFGEAIFPWPLDALFVLKFDYDVPAGASILYSGNGSMFLQFPLYYRNGAISAGEIKSGDTCFLQYQSGVFNLLANDRWILDIASKQDTLVGSGAGQNIKTVNWKSLLGNGNIQLGKGVAIVNSTAGADNYDAVTCELVSPGMDLTELGGIILLAYFNHDMPAHGRLSITDGGNATVCTHSDICYPDSPSHILAAGDINAGDVCLMQYFHNGGLNMTWLVANLTRVPSMRTINGCTLYGSGDISLIPTHTYRSSTMSTANATTSVTFQTNERVFLSVAVSAANTQLDVDILNSFDNTIYIVGQYSSKLKITVNGATIPIIFEYSDFFDGENVIPSKVGAVKFVVEIVNGEAFVDVDAMYAITPKA